LLFVDVLSGCALGAGSSSTTGWGLGHPLANKGRDTRAIQGRLGHRSITSTAVYTALAPNRLKDFWRD
jgi:site-specific recombinase XerD